MTTNAIPTKPRYDFKPLTVEYIQRTAAKYISSYIVERPSIWFHSGPYEMGILGDQLIVKDADGAEVMVPLAEIIAYTMITGTPT